MKTIFEIFENKKELLESDEGKELIENIRIWIENIRRIKTRNSEKLEEVEEIIMRSELICINGESAKESLKKIFELDL